MKSYFFIVIAIVLTWPLFFLFYKIYVQQIGKEDNLLGLKENVIIGRLIPVSPERAKLEK